jgi:CheY-like chemotaxis protein
VELGCTVVEAAHGGEAMDLLERHRFDLMVLDVVMPVLDGIDTLERVRRSPTLQHLPVVVLSAVCDEVRVRRLVHLGIAGYLVKPLHPLEVAERLRRLLPTLAVATRPRVPHQLAGPPASPAATLRPQLLAAAVQVCGMMLGLEIHPTSSREAGHADDLVVSLPLCLEGEPQNFVFSLAIPRASCERVRGASLHGGGAPGEDDAVTATMREIAAVIGNRLQSALRIRGHAVTLGPTAVTRAGDESVDDLEEADLTVSFASRTQEFRFTTVLRAVPASRPQPPRGLHTKPVARILTMDMSLLPPPVDTEVLDMLASLQEPGEPDLLVELVTLFLRDTPERYHTLALHPLHPSSAGPTSYSGEASAGTSAAMRLQESAAAFEMAT